MKLIDTLIFMIYTNNLTPKIQISHEGKSTKTKLDVFDKDRSRDTVIMIIVSVLKTP